MYRAFVLLNVVPTALLALAGLRAAMSISSPFPTGFLWYYPVVFGLFGAFGLYRVATCPSQLPGTRLRKDIIFLSVGVLGAVLLMLGLQGASLPPTAWMWLAPFLCGPVVIAILEIRRRVPWLAHGGASAQVEAAIVVVILLLPIAMGVSRVVAKEALTSWYGREFPSNAIQSAERIAAGKPYRIHVPGYPASAALSDLDKDALLDRAFENHFKIGGMSGLWIEPHITLYVGEEKYLWSFREGQFYR